MAARRLNNQASILSLLPQNTYTLSQLRNNPHGTPHVATFEALDAEGMQVLTEEINHIKARSEAHARIGAADGKIDDFVSRLAKTVLTVTGDDRGHPIYLHFFGKKSPSDIRRPVLGTELETVRSWMTALEESPHAALNAMAPELAALITEADGAVEARREARKQNRFFRDVGPRQQWVDRMNAARKELYGALSKLPFQHAGLSSDFADQFFLSAPDREEDEAEAEPETAEEQRAVVEARRQELAEAEARLAELEEAEAEAEKAARALEAEKAALAELDRFVQEAEQKRAALRARIEAAAG
jgi:DNA repair exonuclease SbcCD ATPase subunit